MLILPALSALKKAYQKPKTTKEVEMSVKARLDEEKEMEIGENREDR